MPVPITTQSEFEAHLSALGVEKGMHLAVHSRLISFGRMEGGAETVFNALSNAVGVDGTLVFPAYTLNLTAEDIYDTSATPSHGMGGLTEFVRKETNSYRTLCPMHGHLVTGANSNALMSADPNQSMGPGSSFEVMALKGFHLLLLGCSFHEGATYVHHAEALKGVPYREWLDLPRRVRSNGKTISDVCCRYYGRKKDTAWDTDLSAVEIQSRKLGFTRVIPVHGRSSTLMSLKSLNNCIFEMIDEDPYVLMRANDTD